MNSSMTSDGADLPISKEQLLIDFVAEMSREFPYVSLSYYKYRANWCLRLDKDANTAIPNKRTCYVAESPSLLDIPDVMRAVMKSQASEIQMQQNQQQPIRRLPPKEIKKSLFERGI